MLNIEERLLDIMEKGLFREMNYIDGPQDTYTTIEGKRVLLLSSNSYLGLCNDARLKETAMLAIREFGVGAGGSRLTTGSYRLHKELEDKLAEFKGTEAAIVFSTGYAANIGTISAIVDKEWVVFCDRLNHASIIDGIRLSGAKLVIYKHCDVCDLENKVKRYHKENGIIITDGVFSMDGDIAPMSDIIAIAKKYGLMTMVDDAHATGVLGANGSGTTEYFNIKDGIDIQMGTLSKGLASEGGYIAGKRTLIEYLRHKAKSFVYSTALAPHNIAVALKALEIVREEPWRRDNLIEKSVWFRAELIKSGFTVEKNITPIIPLVIGDADKAVGITKALLEEGIYVPAIRPPTVPEGTSRLRFSLMATHEYDDLKMTIRKIEKLKYM